MQSSKLKAQNYNSLRLAGWRGEASEATKPTSFKLVVKVLTFDFCLLSYPQTGGLS